MKGIISAIISFLLLTISSVEAQYLTTTNNGAITITGYTGTGGSVTIPSSINGLPVTSIGSNAFINNFSVNVITVPDSVTNIDNHAFDSSFGLSTVTTGNGVLAIGNSAFAECINLLNVTLGTNVLTIGPYAFATCGFNKITLPSSVKSLGDEVFQGAHLTSISIPNSLTNIGANPFAGCVSLATITVPTNHPTLTNFTGILFNKNLTTLIAYPGAKTGSSYTVSNNVLSIGRDAFDGAGSLTNVIISASVTNIAGALFENCYNLTAITVDTNNPAYVSPNGVLFTRDQTTLIEYPEGNTNTAYAIPAGVTNIGDVAFAGTRLASIAIPDGVISIGSSTFQGCSALTNLTIPASVTTIGNGAFFACSSLKSVNIPNGVTSIGISVFGDTGLTNVTIPDAVTNIGGVAFAGCSSLTNVTVSANVVIVDNFAFSSCNHLTAIYFKGNAPVTNSTVFLSDTNATVYYLPGASGWTSTFDGRPTALWTPSIQTGDGSFGVQSNQFGFNISWAGNLTVVVQASLSLSSPLWSPIATNTLTNGVSYFNDPNWTGYSSRFYRLTTNSP